MTDSPSASVRPEIERICSDFDQEWRKGEPDLERLQAIVAKIPAQIRQQCLPLLLAIDFEYRWMKNDVRLPRDYAAIFPADQAIVLEALKSAPRAHPPTTCQQLMAAIDHSGLLTFGMVEDFFTELPAAEQPANAHALAQRLVEAGKLTHFQSRVLLSGDGFELVRGGYVILRLIGRGGMGAVYEAWQPIMSRWVAYKIVKDNEDGALRQRFQREVAISGTLESDHIVRAYDTGEFQGTRYLAMALVEGGDLATLVHRRKAMPGAAAVECLKQVAAGLYLAHSRRIIHRDIKPGNILWDVRLQRAAIADWGVARFLEDPPEGDGDAATREVRQRLAHSSRGVFIGTRGFAPREQLDGGQCDQRSDIFALGKTLQCLLAGTKVPSQAEHLMFGGGDFVSGLDEAYRDMVADDPEDRYQTVAELLEDLRRIQPVSSVGLDNMRRWLATTPGEPVSLDEAVNRRTFFLDRSPTESFMKKMTTPQLSRLAAQERIRAVLADAERWQPPTV